MKKLLSLILLLALSVSLFAGCAIQPIEPTEPSTEPTEPTKPQSFLESAKTLLFNEYKPASKDEVPEKKKDFALMNNIMAGGDNHSVVWTVTVTSGDPESVKVVDNAKVDVPENSPVEILFTLNATISDPYGNNANLSFNFKVPVYVPSSLSVVDPVAGKSYKLGMVQENLDDTLYYFAGGKSGTYYLGTSEKEADALDVYLEATEGGYYLYYLDNDAKVYINHIISGTHVNGEYAATPSTVYTYDAELKTITIKVQAEDDAEPVIYLLGTRSTKNNSDLGFYKQSDAPFFVKFYGFDPNACVHTGGTPSCTAKAVCDLCGEEYGVKLDHEYDATTHLCVCGAHDPKVTVTLTIPEALETPDGQNIVVSGTVSSIYQAYNPDFNNISVYITDGNGNTLYVYRMTGEVAVGDIITVTGTMGSYNGSKQVAQGSTFVKTGHDNSYDYVNMSIPEVLAAEDGTNVIVSGTVIEINGEWSTQYKNMNVTIADASGNKLYVYRTSTQVALGDIITVKGSVGSYNGAKQIAQGSTAEITGHDDSVGNGGTTEPTEEPTQDPTQKPSDEPTVTPDAPFADGDQIVIVAKAYNIALSSTASTGNNNYQAGVAVTVTDGVIAGYGTTETWIVIANDDGTYSFEQGGKKLAMQDSYGSMKLGAAHDKWELVPQDNGTYMLKNVKRGNYIEWYASKNNWSTYNNTSDVALFQLAFYVVG